MLNIVELQKKHEVAAFPHFPKTVDVTAHDLNEHLAHDLDGPVYAGYAASFDRSYPWATVSSPTQCLGFAEFGLYSLKIAVPG